MKSSRRNFARALALGMAAVPAAPRALAQEDHAVPNEAIELGVKVINVKTTEKRDKEIREALQNTAKQVAGIRAYRLKRDTPPCLGLGVFDA